MRESARFAAAVRDPGPPEAEEEQPDDALMSAVEGEVVTR